jgi:hypothetical protein
VVEPATRHKRTDCQFALNTAAPAPRVPLSRTVRIREAREAKPTRNERGAVKAALSVGSALRKQSCKEELAFYILVW